MTYVKEFVPFAIGVNVGVTAVDETSDPVVVLTFPLLDGTNLSVGIVTEAMEDMLLAIASGMVKARAIQEMVTIWPERREEILRNLLFRWSGVMDDGEADGG